MNSKQHPLWNKWRYIKGCLGNGKSLDVKIAKQLNLRCDWLHWQHFRDDVEAHLGLPKPGQELVRKDMTRGWHLNNLHYTTPKGKGGLLRKCLYVKYKGKKYCAKHLAEKQGINYATFLGRLQRGWPVKLAVKP